MPAAHAPPRPSVTSSTGPKQHAVAPNAARKPPTSDAWALMDSTLDSVVAYRCKGVPVMDAFTIGQVAAKSGVHKETIRYYQGLGLVDEPVRPPGSVRRYGDAAIARLRFIKRAQHLGFSLDEVRKLLLLEDGQNCAETRKLAVQKVAV